MTPSAISPPEHRKALHRALRAPVGLRLPSPPKALLRMQRLFRDPKVNFRKLADAISLDPAMSAAVLRLSRSPLYGLARPPRTLIQAVASVGMKELERMVISQIAVQGIAASPAGLRLYLREAYGSALMTRALCRRHEPLLDPGLSWPAGLLFDLGKLLRLSLKPDEDEEIRRRMLTQASTYSQAEAALELPDHHLIGASLLYKWQLPLVYADVTLYGSRPDPMVWPGTQESLAMRRLVASAHSLLELSQERLDTEDRARHCARVQDLLQLEPEGLLEELSCTYQILPSVDSLLEHSSG